MRVALAQLNFTIGAFEQTFRQIRAAVERARRAGADLALFTELPMDEVRRLGALQGAEVNDAKKVLATEATALLHGRAAAEAAAETARRAFEEGAAAEGLPSIEVARADLEAGLPVVDLLVSAGLAASKGEARRLIAGSGVYLDGRTVSDGNEAPTPPQILQVGKRRFAKLVKA